MYRNNTKTASLFDALFFPLAEYTHIAYAVDGENETITKIGVATENENGDIRLSINPKHSTKDVFLYKKDELLILPRK